jgi:shikimate dehydrogenase
MALITGDTKLLGLLGHETSYTLSPAMHNHAAKNLHKDAVYVNFDLRAEYVKEFLGIFWQLGGVGLNVTVPHKSLVASLVETDGLTAVNTLVRNETGWTGYSTDGEGFLHGLSRAKATIQDFEAVIILGSGGSAQSILGAIAQATMEKPPITIIHRRSKNHDAKIHEAVSKAPVQILTFRGLTPEAFADTLENLQGIKKLVIQATSAPKNGDNLARYSSAIKLLTPDDLLVDIIYDQPSDIYFEAIRLGLNCLDGMPMLIEQARLSQFLWWKKSASYDDMLYAIKHSGWRPR